MELVIVILITSIVIWKNWYTFYLILKFYKMNNRKETTINIIFLFIYTKNNLVKFKLSFSLMYLQTFQFFLMLQLYFP